MIKNLISRWTMVKLTRTPFYDKVAGKMVYYWQDYYFENAGWIFINMSK